LRKPEMRFCQKRIHVVKQLSKIGIRTTQLTTQELVELFYDIYNPTKISEQKITASVHDYTTPMVSPAVEGEEEDVMSEPTTSPSATSMPSPSAKPVQPSQTTPTASEGSPSSEPQSTVPAQIETPLSAQSTAPPQSEAAVAPNPTSNQQSQLKAASQQTDESMPNWMKTVEEKVQKDQHINQPTEPAADQATQTPASPHAGQPQNIQDVRPNQQAQPRLARIQPQKPQQQNQVIGGRVATSPGQVSGQTNPNAPGRPQPPGPADLDSEQTVYSS